MCAAAQTYNYCNRARCARATSASWRRRAGWTRLRAPVCMASSVSSAAPRPPAPQLLSDARAVRLPLLTRSSRRAELKATSSSNCTLNITREAEAEHYNYSFLICQVKSDRFYVIGRCTVQFYYLLYMYSVNAFVFCLSPSVLSTCCICIFIGFVFTFKFDKT